MYYHPETGAALIVYVDDLLLTAPPHRASGLWRALERSVQFKDLEAPTARYLGAQYCFDEFDPKKPNAPRTMTTEMNDYIRSAVEKFTAEFGRGLSKVSSPYLTNEEWAEEGVPGHFAPNCASHVATLLFASRVARPDISVAVQRLCRVVSKWTTTHDAALVRLYAYLKWTGHIALRATLAPTDLRDVHLVLWSDADWCGDAEDTKSTSGALLELYSASSGRRWPLSLAVQRQSATSSSTAEAETVALSSSARQHALPMQILLVKLLQQPIEVVAMVDNTQALIAVAKGYSKRLRFLERSHRCAIGFLHELLTEEKDEHGPFYAEYSPTAEHRADGLTKALVPSKFLIAREFLGMVVTT